jgi:hypothetical protein
VTQKKQNFAEAGCEASLWLVYVAVCWCLRVSPLSPAVSPELLGYFDSAMPPPSINYLDVTVTSCHLLVFNYDIS